MIPAAEVHRVLDILGPDHHQVAGTLAAKGIRGTHFQGTCPISTYLSEQFPEAEFLTGNYFTSVFQGGQATDYALPFAIRAFVGHFDGGEFPELES